MAADVSSLVQILNGYTEEQMRNESGHVKSKVLITRDLLGGCSSKLGSKELDLDLQVPNGWEKRLDLKFGKVYLQRCNSPISSSGSSSNNMREQHQDHKNQNRTISKLQDLNFPPSANSSTSTLLLDERDLDLKLVASSYQSVCTLDKVKSALERAERESGKKKRSSSSSSSSSPSSLSSIVKKKAEEGSSCSGLLFASGCPGCLLYVLISRENPSCPRCGTVVRSPVMKKPRIDLNASI